MTEQDTDLDLTALEVPLEPTTTNDDDRAVLKKPNPALLNNNSVLVAFLHALLSLLLFNFNNKIKNDTSRKRATEGSRQSNDSASQARNDGFEVEEVPNISAGEEQQSSFIKEHMQTK